jgi:hypothetical protein
MTDSLMRQRITEALKDGPVTIFNLNRALGCDSRADTAAIAAELERMRRAGLVEPGTGGWRLANDSAEPKANGGTKRAEPTPKVPASAKRRAQAMPAAEPVDQPAHKALTRDEFAGYIKTSMADHGLTVADILDALRGEDPPQPQVGYTDKPPALMADLRLELMETIKAIREGRLSHEAGDAIHQLANCVADIDVHNHEKLEITTCESKLPH